MKTIDTSYGFNRIILLLTILELIAFNNEYQYLASPVIQDPINDRDMEKLNKVYKYVLDNINQDISLDKAASILQSFNDCLLSLFQKKSK